MAYRVVEEAFVPLETSYPRVSSTVLLDVIRATDIAIVVLASVLAGTAYLGWFWRPGPADPTAYAFVTVLGSFTALAALSQAGIYEVDRLRARGFQISRVLVAWTAGIMVLVAAAFLLKTSATFSRGWLLLWWSFGGLGLATSRVAIGVVAASMATRGRLGDTVAVVGSGAMAARVLKTMGAAPGTGPRLLGVFDDSRRQQSSNEHASVRTTGTIDDLVILARQLTIDKVVIALPADAEAQIEAIVQELSMFPCEVVVCLGQLGDRLKPTDLGLVGGVPVARISRKPLEDWQIVWKGIEDKVAAVAAVVVLWPVFAAAALAIRIESPGPVFFCQRRFGFNNQPITIYKFRTMYHDMADPDGGRQAVRNDPRVTKVGRLLRRTNLDELPQFLNVLQGRLSVVGPRPHALTMRAADRLYHEAVDAYATRHKVKPGITGWAQVNGLRGETDTLEKAQRRVEYDLSYIDDWSLLLDLKIILLTFVRGFRDPNAY